MLLRKAYILVHVECDHILERNFARLVHADKFLICSYRCTTGRESENERLVSYGSLCLDSRYDVARSPYRAFCAVFMN